VGQIGDGPGSVAAIVEIRISRFFTWESSWARTPSALLVQDPHDAFRDGDGRMLGVAPVAKAFGVSVGIR